MYWYADHTSQILITTEYLCCLCELIIRVPQKPFDLFACCLSKFEQFISIWAVYWYLSCLLILIFGRNDLRFDWNEAAINLFRLQTRALYFTVFASSSTYFLRNLVNLLLLLCLLSYRATLNWFTSHIISPCASPLIPS